MLYLNKVLYKIYLKIFFFIFSININFITGGSVSCGPNSRQTSSLVVILITLPFALKFALFKLIFNSLPFNDNLL